MTKTLITIVIVVAVGLGAWQLFDYWQKVQDEKDKYPCSYSKGIHCSFIHSRMLRFLPVRKPLLAIRQKSNGDA